MSDPRELGLSARHDEELDRLQAGLADLAATFRLLRETAWPAFGDPEGDAPRLEGGQPMTPSVPETSAAYGYRTVRRSRAARWWAGSVLGVAALVLATPAAAAGLASADESAPSRELLDRMAQGRMDTDLGRYDAAIAAFAAVVGSKEAPAALRTEALVRLGVARRESGDPEGAFAALERASKDPGLDRDTKALLVRAVGGVLPGDERWGRIWPQVSFAPDRSDSKHPTLAILWPGVPRMRQEYEDMGTPISLHFQDGDLQDIFRLFADISGLNVVVHPGVSGLASLKVNEEPWVDVLRRILDANGLAFRLEDTILEIAPPERLGPPRHFGGRRIDVDWGPDADPAHPGQGQGLKEALDEIAAAGQASVALDPGVQGRVVFKLNRVRWDQAFDVLARVNGLEWTRDGSALKVFPRRNPAR